MQKEQSPLKTRSARKERRRVSINPEALIFDGEVDNTTTTKEEAPKHRYNLRGNRERSYGHRLDHIMNEGNTNGKKYGIQLLQMATDASYSMHRDEFVKCKQSQRSKTKKDDIPSLKEALEGVDETPGKLFNYVTGFLFTQMTADKGIKRYGQAAVDALFKEFAQLNDQSVFTPMRANLLSKGEKRDSLASINLIKEKRCGKIKGRSVADGRKQRKLYGKDEITSPTVSTDALLMTLIIDAMEERKVAIADVPGAYLHATMEDHVIVRMTGKSVDVMCQVNPSYKAYVTMEKGTKVLYLKLNKALYGCVKSAMLWYDLFANTLKTMGFKINPYDNCVANMMVNGKQLTIVWYVDDLKVSHVDKQVVLDTIKKIDDRFNGKLAVTTGKKHTYLGMDVTFTEERTVQILMREYLTEAIDAFGEDITRTASTPAKKNLFSIDWTAKKLDTKRDELFKHIVAKLLYVAKRSRIDIQLAIGFLCTRVSCGTDEDWEKLRRVLQYLKGTLDEYLILGSQDLTTMGCWIDAAFAVHDDMKSHTGVAVSFGRGSVMSNSGKQKLNTNSSTEAELVGCSNGTKRHAIYGSLFMQAQGYTVDTTVFQDNSAAIKLEKNGRRSCSQKSRHIDIRYFYMKDLVEKGIIKIEYCPTEAMIADFFTKPLQGSLFKTLKKVIMGQISVKDFSDSLATKERVEERVVTDGNQRETDERDERDDVAGQRKFPTYAECVRGIK